MGQGSLANMERKRLVHEFLKEQLRSPDVTGVPGFFSCFLIESSLEKVLVRIFLACRGEKQTCKQHVDQKSYILFCF